MEVAEADWLWEGLVQLQLQQGAQVWAHPNLCRMGLVGGHPETQISMSLRPQ